VIPSRIALLTLPSVISDAASLAAMRLLGPRLVLLGLSDPMRPAAGGVLGQLRRRIGQSGPRILPYLALGYGLPGRAGRLRHTAAAIGAPSAAVADVNGAAFRDMLAAARPDLIVTLHFDQILADETLALAPKGGVNLHPSLLPAHRGPIPAFWALAEGGAGAGVSLHRMVARIDAGTVLAQRRVALPPGISALAAARLLHLEGVGLLASLVAGGLPETDAPAAAPRPYCGFPDAMTLRASGVTLVAWRDWGLALGAAGRGPEAP